MGSGIKPDYWPGIVIRRLLVEVGRGLEYGNHCMGLGLGMRVWG